MCKNTRNTSKQPLHCGLLQDLAEPSPHPPHTRGTFHCRLQPLYTEKRTVSCSGFLPTTNHMQHSCSHYNAFRNHSFQKRAIQKAHRTTHTWTTTRCRILRENQSHIKTNGPHPPAHRKYLSSPAAASHGKTQGFVPRLPPQHKPHARFMQPSQCDLQPAIQQAQRITHTWTTTRCRTPRENQSHIETVGPHPPHTGGTFHCRLQPLYTEKRKVSCSGFLR